LSLISVTNIMNRKTCIFLAFLLFVSFSCKKTNSLGPSPVPYVYVYTQIDYSTPLYSNLNNEGGYVYINGGNKGLLVLQDFLGNFWAFDRTCPYHVTSPCGVVRMSTSGLSIVCGSYSGQKLDTCCGTTYGFDGSVTHKPGWYPLKAYRVTVSGTVLTISN